MAKKQTQETQLRGKSVAIKRLTESRKYWLFRVRCELDSSYKSLLTWGRIRYEPSYGSQGRYREVIQPDSPILIAKLLQQADEEGHSELRIDEKVHSCKIKGLEYSPMDCKNVDDLLYLTFSEFHEAGRPLVLEESLIYAPVQTKTDSIQSGLTKISNSGKKWVHSMLNIDWGNPNPNTRNWGD